MKISVGDKSITIKKWKGKHKKEFIRLLKEDKPDELAIMETLVYSCIDEDVILSTEEFRYVLMKIRALSLGKTISADFYCEKCGELHKHEFNLEELLKPVFKPIKKIEYQGTKIKLGPIRNKKIYIEKVSEDDIYDLLMRVSSINNNDGFSLLELEEIIEELDIDVIEEIFNIWEDHRFKLNDINEVECPHCHHKELYKFDELPGFFPDSWFSNE